MSPPGRPKGEYRSATPGGTSVIPIAASFVAQVAASRRRGRGGGMPGRRAVRAGSAAAQAAGAGAYPDRSDSDRRSLRRGQSDGHCGASGRRQARGCRPGEQVVIENHPGASGNIGSELVGKAAADGHTLLMTGSLITLLPSTLGPVAVDPVASFSPITKLARAADADRRAPVAQREHAAPSSSRSRGSAPLARSLTRRPASTTVQHLICMGIISRDAGIEMLHIPYANSGQALKDVQAGEGAGFLPLSSARSTRCSQQRAAQGARGREQPANSLPVARHSNRRRARLQGRHSGQSVERCARACGHAALKMVNRLYREFARIVELPDVRDRFAQMGMEPLDAIARTVQRRNQGGRALAGDRPGGGNSRKSPRARVTGSSAT